MKENEISKKILNAATEAHRTLGGPGLLESVYEEALAWELVRAGCPIRRQAQSPINHKGTTLATSLRIGLLVDELVIVECKAISQYNSIAETQTLT